MLGRNLHYLQREVEKLVAVRWLSHCPQGFSEKFAGSPEQTHLHVDRLPQLYKPTRLFTVTETANSVVASCVAKLRVADGGGVKWSRTITGSCATAPPHRHGASKRCRSAVLSRRGQDRGHIMPDQPKQPANRCQIVELLLYEPRCASKKEKL